MQARLCFAFNTALQILRTMPEDELDRIRGVSLELPSRAPTLGELRIALQAIESTRPGLRLKKPAHVLVDGSIGYRVSHQLNPHTCTVGMPRGSLLRLKSEQGALCLTGAAATLIQMATTARTEASLLELGWEMCGSYQTGRTGVPSAYDVRPMTCARALREYVAAHPTRDGARKLARVLPYLADGSASARETKLALVIGLPMARGGGGLGIPHMNYEVPASPTARAISGRGSFRCDLCWPEAKIDVEYQSRENHEGERSRIRDSRRTNALVSMGWTVIGVTNDELDSMVATDAIVQSIRRLLGKRMRVKVRDYHARKLKLRRQLGLPVGYE